MKGATDVSSLGALKVGIVPNINAVGRSTEDQQAGKNGDGELHFYFLGGELQGASLISFGVMVRRLVLVSMEAIAIKSRSSVSYRHEIWPDILSLRVGGVENYCSGS